MSESTEEEPLRRARRHLQRAMLEGLEAALALLQAALQSRGLREITDESLAATLQQGLEDLIGALRANASFVVPQELAAPLVRALDAEIAKWEERSKTDADARPVLRTFLGLRELLWELGLRPEEAPGQQPDRPRPPEREQPTRARRDGPRVQRFDIEH